MNIQQQIHWLRAVNLALTPYWWYEDRNPEKPDGRKNRQTPKEIDLKTAATTTIIVPTGSRFYPNEVGIILTTLGGTITLQPDVSFGITGTNNKFVTQTTSSLTAVYERDVYTSLTTAGEATLTFTVNTAATGSADIKGRAYFKGMLVEIQ